MGFATSWLDKRALFPEFIDELPDNQTGIIVVIPAFDESDIADVLNSLATCDVPGCKVEVIVIVNAPANAEPKVILNNKACLNNIERWRKENRTFFRLFYFDAGQPAIKGWGVGLARKTGMDEALRRFNSADNPAGLIASLDADCRVEKNYLTALYSELYKDKNRKACSVYFEHPLDGNEFSADIFDFIIQYELHLRYYMQGLKFAGFPFAFHTVGSSMAVKASSYAACGGMNRRQAGEDFYFIQKLMPLGGYFALNSTAVYPSPRESSRVPFGTGTAMARLMKSGNDSYMTYNIDAFKELRHLFSLTGELYKSDKSKIASLLSTLPPGLKSFFSEDEISAAVAEIKENTSGPESFRKRFFTWFNMFRIVRYLNHVSTDLFIKQPVEEAALKLLEVTDKKTSYSTTQELLEYYRSMERGVSYSSW